MNHEQLMAQYFRLKRKLSTSYATWNSGRIDRLEHALHSVERQLGGRQPELAQGGAANAARPAHSAS